jgi:hypothetical protein
VRQASVIPWPWLCSPSRDTTGGVNFVTVSGAYTFQFEFSFFDFGAVQLDGKARVPLIS